MSAEQKENSYKHIPTLADSLFVLSQVGLKSKLDAMELSKKSIEGLEIEEILKLKNQIESTLREQRYFQAERQTIIRFLLENKQAKFSTYVIVKNSPYGLITINGRKFYCVVNKKLIKRFKATQSGNEFNAFELLSNEELDAIITVKEAKRIFKLYHAFVVRRNQRKAQQLKKTVEVSTQKSTDTVELEKSEPPVELEKSKLINGKIFVVKKRSKV